MRPRSRESGASGERLGGRARLRRHKRSASLPVRRGWRRLTRASIGQRACDVTSGARERGVGRERDRRREECGTVDAACPAAFRVIFGSIPKPKRFYNKNGQNADI